MNDPLRGDEIRIIIKSAAAPTDSARLIPAVVLQRTFSTVLGALKAADISLHARKYRSTFVISDLRMSSNIVAIRENATSQNRAIDLVHQTAGAVYRSDFGRAAQDVRTAKAVIAMGKGIDPEYPAVFQLSGGEIPLDEFFARQASRFSESMSPTTLKPRYHIGSTIGAFDGTLGNIDYRGTAWIGHLVLAGGGAQIECVFDREKGEDAFNPFGNKRVTVRGRAIYTGDSQLPERIEVQDVEEIPRALEAVDIRGALEGKRYFSAWDIGSKNLQ